MKYKQTKQDRNDRKNIVDNLVRDPELSGILHNKNEYFQVENFTIVSNKDNVEKTYLSCSAYASKSEAVADFK